MLQEVSDPVTRGEIHAARLAGKGEPPGFPFLALGLFLQYTGSHLAILLVEGLDLRHITPGRGV